MKLRSLSFAAALPLSAAASAQGFGPAQEVTSAVDGPRGIHAADLDGDGVPDFEDLLAGTSADCNGNTIPDECEVASGAAGDCDGDGVLDSCEIAAGAADCDGDGRPDACDIAADPTLDLDGDGTLDRCEAVGATYCAPAVPNSTGRPGEVTLLGSADAALNDLELTVRGLPPSTFGYFITSAVPAALSPIPNSVGTLCVTGSVGRGVGILNSGPAGVFRGVVDLTALPQPTGPIAVQPGDTWHFQAWHRDSLLGGLTTSNFTDAVAVTFR
ncbi:MAG: hypothetical protein ISQ11_02635 [Planctomycetes bacterium]|nr:hypothetical protein [Planctomycetota bacterium]